MIILGRNRSQDPIGSEYLEFGQRIKALRQASGMTQEELSKELGISKTSVVNYETGTRKVPLELIIKFSEFFGVSIDSLTGVNFTGYNDNEHAVLSTNPNVIRTTRRWYDEVGVVDFTDEEIDELVAYAKYLIYKRQLEE